MLPESSGLAASGATASAVGAAHALFDRFVPLIATVSTEARASVRQGAASPQLVQLSWRIFLVRVDNAQIVPGCLDVTSPQAKPANNRYPPGQPYAAPEREGKEDHNQVSAGDRIERWLDIDVLQEAPLPSTLAPVAIERKVIALYARDTGRRSARRFTDIGPSTGDIGDRG